MTLKPIRLRPEAEREIEEAFDYYLGESPRIAGRFLDEIASSLKKIQRDPQLYPAYTRNTRRRVLGSFPFSVIYQETKEIILIVAIAHAKRREGSWTKRLKQ
jgi:plasmid stabilization system protein ParE